MSIKILAREFTTMRPAILLGADHQALRKQIYTGDFNGVMYRGTYTPLVSLQTWERVGAILDGRNGNKSCRWGREFTLSG